MKCLVCQSELTGRKRKFCSDKCKRKDYFTSGKLVNYQKRMAYHRKVKLVNMFGGSCEKCGYNRCLRALNFHHNDRKLKLFCVNHYTLQSKKWETILEEAKKCSLLCSNCHTEFHSEEDRTYIFDETDLAPYEYMKNLPEKKPFICRKCNKSYYSNNKNRISSYCSLKCCGLSHRKVERPSQDLLNDQVKRLGFKGTARLYSVSDNSIRKWLKAYELSTCDGS